jgi:hypothetical protein
MSVCFIKHNPFQCAAPHNFDGIISYLHTEPPDINYTYFVLFTFFDAALSGMGFIVNNCTGPKQGQSTHCIVACISNRCPALQLSVEGKTFLNQSSKHGHTKAKLDCRRPPSAKPQNHATVVRAGLVVRKLMLWFCFCCQL